MSRTVSSSSSGGVGFFGLLTILFVGLKLTGYINWSWLWVLAPLWGGFTLFFALFAVLLLIAAARTGPRNRGYR